MKRNADIVAMAAKAFANHIMTRERGCCWRLGKRGSVHYSFRISWHPGAVVMTGDLGETIWRGPSDFWISPWEAARLIAGCDLHYLFGKSTGEREFDAEGTIRNILQIADEQMKFSGSTALWTTICDHYGLDGAKVTDHMKAARLLREGGISRPGDAYHITSDFEFDSHRIPPQAVWQFEAVQLWARTMIDREPLTSRLARRRRRVRGWFRDLKSYPVIWRPTLYRRRKGHPRTDLYRRGDHGAFRLLRPARLFSHDLSRFDLWRDQGGSTPGRFEDDFELVAQGAGA